MSPKEILQGAKTILAIDWPSKDVPESLVRAGLGVVVKGGPGPEDYVAYELSEGKVVSRRIGRAPERVDVVYSYRPIGELPQILELAKSLNAKAIWTQSGRDDAGREDPKGCWLSQEDLSKVRELAQSAGLIHIASPYVGDVARDLGA